MPPPSASKRRRSASPARSGSGKTAATPVRPTTDSPRDWKRRKQPRGRHDAYDAHRFLDASATVHAGLFAARRLPEIKSLWRHAVRGGWDRLDDARAGGDADEPPARRPGESGGGKISSRHLRRRTNGHRRRRRHRFPRGKDGSGADDSDAGEGPQSGDDGARGGERSDAAAHGDRSAKKKGRDERKPCRRARRKPALMKMSHSQWWQPRTTNAQANESTAADGANASKAPHHWIPTHLWHAKRFRVSPPLFSWSIPLIHSNRGSRASLRLASSESFPKCTIQDATWEVDGRAIRLELTQVDPSPSERRPVQTLAHILGRICGADAPFLREEGILAGRLSGEGLVFEIDACPLRPIGPATFIFGRPGDASENACLSIFVHPTIHQRVTSLLATVLSSEIDSNLTVTLTTMPLALLRVRGRASTPTLRAVLEHAENVDSLDDGAEHGHVIELGTPPFLAPEPRNGANPKPNGMTPPSSMLLKSHKPNQRHQHLPHNLACSGWDVLCHPSVAPALFRSFVNNGGACAVGLTEDARARLEAHPPLPIFPRDYPDTPEGKSYWEGSMREVRPKGNDDASQSTDTWKDWAVIRTCVEGSWGRINTPLGRTIRHWKEHDGLVNKKKEREKMFVPQDETKDKPVSKRQIFGRDLVSINWETLISKDAEFVIVVRGPFGIPFLQLLHGCGRLSSPECRSSETSRRRRPRRKIRPPSSNVYASPLSKNDSEAHSNLCQQLRASLSLPAILRCELHCDGGGTLGVGDLILPFASRDDGAGGEGSDAEDSSRKVAEKLVASTLGVVVTGGFSPSRGKCHGIGFVGAAKLIDALDGTEHGVGMTVPQSNGQKTMMLKVMIVRDKPGACRRCALLSILL